MPFLTRACLGLVVLASFVTNSRVAFAAEMSPPLRDFVHVAPDSADLHWELALRAGYGKLFTSGLDYIGPGYGGAIAHVFGRHFRLEATFVWSSGSDVAASSAYRSTVWSYQLAAGAGYEGHIGPFFVRPEMRFGTDVLLDRTKVAQTQMKDAHIEPVVGPCLEVAARVGHFELGVLVESFFLPRWITAPTTGVYGVAGIAL